jgi:hypothetical protein
MFLITEKRGKELEKLILNSPFVKIEEANQYPIMLTEYNHLVAHLENLL